MSKIYKVFMSRWTEAWHVLSQAEKDALLKRVGHALEQVGGKGVLYANSFWATEQYHFFGVEEFPNIEAAQKHGELLQEINWERYVDTTSTLGTELLPE